jgi:hypothetical protein
MKVRTMKNTVFTILSILVLTSGLVAQSALAGEAFSWNGELVTLDETARLITVKSRVVGEQTTAELGRLKAGDRVVVIWSGYDKYADAIREVRLAVVNKPEERFTFPAEFVSFDAEHRYLTFKVQIPQNSLGNLKSLKPGEWVTATSPHGPSAKSNPVVMVKPYVEHAGTASSSIEE